jgi:hypothetical protein
VTLYDHIRDQVFNMKMAAGPEFTITALEELVADVAEQIEDLKGREVAA